MMIVASGSVIANSYAFMPVHRQGDETLSIWLQVRTCTRETARYGSPHTLLVLRPSL